MSKKLWFISEDGDLIAVFDDPEYARDELYYLREDDPISTFKVYGLTENQIENYNDEFELAVSEGFINVDESRVG